MMAPAFQKKLFHVNAVIATLPHEKRAPPEVSVEMIDALTAQVDRIEQMEGLVGNRALPGELALAALDVARTACHRAERSFARLLESDDRAQLQTVVAYMNRLMRVLLNLRRRGALGVTFHQSGCNAHQP